jgi:hypothetical protein
VNSCCALRGALTCVLEKCPQVGVLRQALYEQVRVVWHEAVRKKREAPDPRSVTKVLNRPARQFGIAEHLAAFVRAKCQEVTVGADVREAGESSRASHARSWLQQLCPTGPLR